MTDTTTNTGAASLSDEFEAWFDRAYPISGDCGRIKYRESSVRELMTAAYEAGRIAAGGAQEPVAWLIDPGAGSAVDRFQQVEPYAWQYDEVEKRGGSITPLYAAPLPREAAED